MKSTEITRKQVGVLYYKAKNGELVVEKWFINELYNLADYYGYDSNRNAERSERQVKDILEAMFAGDLVKAQELIEYTANDWFESYGRKTQAKCDRSVFVK